MRIDVDPTVFQNSRGTTTIPLTITSNGAVNIPFPVRLVINTRDLDQTGKLVNVPGKIVDILADRVRNHMYLLRQDKNLVLVYDTTTLKQVGQMRTGNTPVSMAITDDQQYLIVGNDRSHLASVFNLDTFETETPILFGDGYPRSIVVARGGTSGPGARCLAAPDVTCTGAATNNPLCRIISPAARPAAPTTLLITCSQVPADSVLANTPSENYVLLAMSDGTTAMWDATVNTWVVSRTNTNSAGGAFGAFTDNLFVVDSNVLDPVCFPSPRWKAPPSSSGVGVMGGAGFAPRTGASGQEPSSRSMQTT